MCLIATRGQNETADLLDAELEARQAQRFWLTPSEALQCISYGGTSTLWNEVERGTDARSLISGLCEVIPGSPLSNADALLSCAGDHADYFDHARYAIESYGLTTLNGADATRHSSDKWATHVALQAAGVPVPRARLVFDWHEASAAAHELGFPLVVKETHGFGGYGVRLANDLDGLRRACDELNHGDNALMIEHYIECAGRDLRLLVLEGQVLGGFNRIAADGDFRSNLSMGGRGTLGVVGADEEHIARAAIEAIGLGWCGLDVGRVEKALPGREYLPEGSLFVFESNSTPGIDGLVTYGGADVSATLLDRLFDKAHENAALASQAQ